MCYLIYSTKGDVSGSFLLELEVEIRAQHPRILLTYYNKHLYQFHLSHWGPQLATDTPEYINAFENSCDRLDQEHPQLLLKQRRTVKVGKLANHTRVSRGASKNEFETKEDQQSDEYLPFASLSFLKAVKKSLLYNISLQGDMVIFGNCVVGKINGTNFQYRVTQIDPILLGNGDIVVSLTQRNSLILFSSLILNLEKNFLDFSLAFVVYVMPSGLRCHLYDTSNVLASFTRTPPKGNEQLARLLQLTTGIKLELDETLLWVKLIPNLQHLNNQTSKIAQFIHNVDNKKFILWPWKLCLLQFGSAEKVNDLKGPDSSTDPLSLISDFLQFSMNCNEESKMKGIPQVDFNKVPCTTQRPFSTESMSSTALKRQDSQKGVTFNFNKDSDHSNNTCEVPGLDLYSSYPDNMSDKMSDDEQNVIDKNQALEETDIPSEAEDDLFGESPTPGNANSGVFDGTPLITADDNYKATNSPNVKENQWGSKQEALDLASDNSEVRSFPQDKIPLYFESNMNQTPSESAIFDIPRDEMITVIHKSPDVSSYEDPGAPLPLAPTPYLPQNNTTLPFSGVSKNPFKQQKVGKGLGDLETGKNPHSRDDQLNENNLKYMFSPIIFNPKIKNKIDTKYGKGGKFYVERDSDSSTSSTRIPFKAGDRRCSSIRNDDFQLELSPTLREDGIPHSRKASHIPDFKTLEDVKSRDDKLTFEPSIESSSQLSQNESNKEFTHWENELDDDSKFFSEIKDKRDDSPNNEEDEDEESDADEEFQENNNSPLTLNIRDSENIISSPNIATSSMQKHEINSKPSDMKSTSVALSQANQSLKNVQPEDYESPNSGPSFGSISASPMSEIVSVKLNPEDIDDNSGAVINGEQQLLVSPNSQNSAKVLDSNFDSDESKRPNYLPLIHRSINVFSIPSFFLLRDMSNHRNANSTSNDFAIDVDDEADDDFESSDGGLSVSKANIEEYLSHLTPNLAFDCGSFNLTDHLKLNLPEFFAENVFQDATDGSVSDDSLKIISSVFPLNYRIELAELLRGSEKNPSNDMQGSSEKSKNQMMFFDQFVDESLLESPMSGRNLDLIYWDTLLPDRRLNKDNFGLYREASKERNRRDSATKINENSIFLLKPVKTKVLKNGKDVVNLDYVGTQFWNYFNFYPINGSKKFQVLLVTENDPRTNSGRIFEAQTPNFLESLKQNLSKNHFGSLKKLHLPAPENRQDLDGINNGLLLIDRLTDDQLYTEYYKNINKRLKVLAELIKLDLINKSNRFEFDRPLLLLFVNFDNSVHSVSQIAKICRNFRLNLNSHHLSLVNFFSHIIPSNSIAKRVGRNCRFKILSELKLSKLSMILYNKCPATSSATTLQTNTDGCITNLLYTNLVKESPSALHFKVLNKISREGSTSAFYDDTFLHVAYERSVDKEWILAAWSDPCGVLTLIKSWHCLRKASDQNTQGNYDLGSIINDIWSISGVMFSKLSKDPLQCTFSSGKKKYLVLTRLSSIIPDDELIHWKRLTTKDKEISLVVLSTNRLPKMLFQSNKDSLSNNIGTQESKESLKTSTNVEQLSLNDRIVEESGTEFIRSFEGVNTSPINGLNFTSPINSNVSQSPIQFLNTPGNFPSPADATNATNTNDSDMIVRPPFHDILAVLPKVALPSFNSPTRAGMLIGYLLKETPEFDNDNVQRYLVFEVTLLSCSAYWNLNSLMKTLLDHYKKLIVINEIIGTCNNTSTHDEDGNTSNSDHLRSFVPWHISAVGKTLEYLTHVNVGGIDP